MKTNNLKTMQKTILFLLLSPFFTGIFSSPLPAQDITGKWHGLLEFQSASLRFDLEVKQQNGQYLATSYSPDQGNRAIPIDTFNYSDGKMEFAIHDLDVKYSGMMDKVSSTIKGTFKQRGQSLPLVFGREIIEAPKGSPDK